MNQNIAINKVDCSELNSKSLANIMNNQDSKYENLKFLIFTSTSRKNLIQNIRDNELLKDDFIELKLTSCNSRDYHAEYNKKIRIQTEKERLEKQEKLKQKIMNDRIIAKENKLKKRQEQKEYNNEEILCEYCNKNIRRKNLNKHNQGKEHKKLKLLKDLENNVEDKENKTKEQIKKEVKKLYKELLIKENQQVDCKNK